jgi:predicted restriction endonuclease
MVIGIVYHTDEDWFKYLIDKNLLNQVDFWTTRATNLKADKGSPFFFKTEAQEIVGVADYLGIEHNITLKETWNKFGPKSGVDNFDKLVEKAKNTLRLEDVNEDTKISYIILDNIVVFRHPVSLEAIDYKGMQTYAKIEKEDIINKIFEIAEISNRQGDLEPQNVDPKFTETLVNSRAFQHQLRNKVTEFYSNRCVLCGIDNNDLLIVSHIKPVNQDKENAGKVKNTLLLCSLHDSMFDKGLISIDKDGSIIISERLKKSQSTKLREEVEFLNNKKLSATDLHQDFSSEFFEWHRKHIFKS